MSKSSSTSGKTLLKNSAIYTASGLLLKCFSFFLLPLYTRYLTTEDYGITNIAQSFASTMGPLIAFSLFSAVLRFYVDLKDNPERLRRFYGTIMTFVFISSVIFGGIFYLLRDFLSEKVFSGIDFYPIILVCILGLIFSCQHQIYGNILKSQQKAVKTSLLTIIFFFVSVILNIVFVVYFKLGALGVLLATFISNALYTAYFLYDMLSKKYMTICLDFKVLKDALHYSIPIIPHQLSTHIAVLISKVLLGGSHSLGVLGIYSVASQFGHLSETVHSYISEAYQPWLFEKLKAKEDGYKLYIRKMVRMLIALIGIPFIFISLFSHDYIVLFIDPKFIDAWKIVPLIILVFGIKTAYYFYIDVLFFYKSASRKIFIATVTGSLSNIILSYFLIPMWGIMGTISANAISMIIRIGIIIFMSQEYEDTGIRLGDFLVNFFTIALFVGGGLSLSFFVYGNNFSVLNLLFKFAVMGLYIGYIYLMFKTEIKSFYNTVKKSKVSKV